jgi:hypothetical protein
MPNYIDARRQTVNNLRFTTLNLPPVSIAPRPLPRPSGGFFKFIGAIVWIIIGLVLLGRCTAHAQERCIIGSDGRAVCGRAVDIYRGDGSLPAVPPTPYVNEIDMPPAGWQMPPARGQAPDTLRCSQIGVEWVCRDKRQETTCRQVGFEFVCDRRAR